MNGAVGAKPGRALMECQACGKSRNVRVVSDRPQKYCRPCYYKVLASKIPGVNPGQERVCSCCGKSFVDRTRIGRANHYTKDKYYCSTACFSADNRVERDCKGCGRMFTIYRSALVKTYSDGRVCEGGIFCSRACYLDWRNGITDRNHPIQEKHNRRPVINDGSPRAQYVPRGTRVSKTAKAKESAAAAVPLK